MNENGKELETKEIFESESPRDGFDVGGMAFFNWIAEAGMTLPPWWSQSRDQELRRFWKECDPLAGAMNAICEIVTTVPYKIVPRNPRVKAHIKAAREFQFNLDNLSQSRANLTSTGWVSMLFPFAEDFFGQDNGGWLVVEGKGVKVKNPYGQMTDGPLLPGSSRRLIQLDSERCWRTNHTEWPLYYTDWDGRQFFIHNSRIINLASQPSSSMDMKGIGFCAVSRCPGIAQNMADMIRYKQEKLGSRPKRGMLVVEGGGVREVKAIENQLSLANEAMDNLGLARFAPLPVVAIKGGGTISLLDMNSIPDGFDELTSVQLGMATMALAFGVDVRTLSFAIGVAGQTRADAEVQHLKTSTKGPAAFIRRLKQGLDSRFLPYYLEIIFDFQDDAQDDLNATIRKKRAERREKDLTNGITDIRVERQQMVVNGELSEQQFIELELKNGRLEDGQPVEMLFHSQDREIIELLGGITQLSMIDEIDEQIAIVATKIQSGLQAKAMQVLSLLTRLRSNQKFESELGETKNEKDQMELIEDV